MLLLLHSNYCQLFSTLAHFKRSPIFHSNSCFCNGTVPKFQYDDAFTLSTCISDTWQIWTTTCSFWYGCQCAVGLSFLQNGTLKYTCGWVVHSANEAWLGMFRYKLGLQPSLKVKMDPAGEMELDDSFHRGTTMERLDQESDSGSIDIKVPEPFPWQGVGVEGVETCMRVSRQDNKCHFCCYFESMW